MIGYVPKRKGPKKPLPPQPPSGGVGIIVPNEDKILENVKIKEFGVTDLLKDFQLNERLEKSLQEMLTGLLKGKLAVEESENIEAISQEIAKSTIIHLIQCGPRLKDYRKT